MEKIDKKNEALTILQSKLQIMKTKLSREEWSRGQVDKKKRLNKIIEAGKLFEEAGILENYDRDEIKKLLVNYRRRNEE